MTKVRRTAGVALGILAAAVVSHVVVSACTAFTSFGINSVSGPPSGPAGSRVAVHGEAFQQAPVDVYWGSVSGPLLATVPSVNFSSVTVTIPADAAPGFYYIVATDHTGPVASVSDHFTVTSTAPPPTATPGPTPNPTPVPSGQQSSPSVPAPSHGLVGATVNQATTHHSIGVAAPAAVAAAPSQAGVSSPANRPGAGSPTAAPSLGKPLNGATGSLSGLPTPVVLGLVFAGLSVVGAAGFGAFLIPRRRRAHAAQTVDTSLDESSSV